MATKEDQFTDAQDFSFFVGTWNVNGQSPDGEYHNHIRKHEHLKNCAFSWNCSLAGSLACWLGGDESPPDFYAIGFQELDLSKEAFVFLESVKEEEWMKAVQAGLHPGAEYSLVKHIRLVGMLLLVYCKKEHLDQVSPIKLKGLNYSHCTGSQHWGRHCRNRHHGQVGQQGSSKAL